MTDNDAVFAGDILPRRVGFLISGIDELLDLVTIYETQGSLSNLKIRREWYVLSLLVC